MSVQWTEEKVDNLVDSSFIRCSLRPEDHQTLVRPLRFGDDPGDVTYLDWITAHARRIFFLLVQIEVPHRIFDIIDQAFDDDDLPLSLEDIARLDLSDHGRDLQIEAAFSRAQNELLSTPKRQEEPDDIKKSKLAIEVISSSSEFIDTVRITSNKSKIFSRRRVPLGNAQPLITKEDFFEDIRWITKAKQQHTISLRTAYISGDSGYVLLSPTIDIPLRTFFTTVPKFFKSLPIEQQQSTLMNWPHCLACALHFLHKQGLHHGKLVPSNIFVDPLNRIYLGFSVFTPSIQCQKKDYEPEVYNYGPPERSRQGPALSPNSLQPKQPRPARKYNIFNRKNSESSSESRSSSTTDSSYLPFGSPPMSPGSPNLARGSQMTSWPFPLPSPDEGVLSARDSQYSKLSGDSSDSGYSSWVPPPPSSSQDPGRDSVSAAALTTDPRSGDIFSLACLAVDIYAFLIKGKQASFVSSRKKTLTIGGSSDPSFHANAAALGMYVDALEKTARAKPEPIFLGVPPSLLLLRRMLSANPQSRPRAIEVVRCMENAMLESSTLYLHCGGGGQF